MDQHPPVVAVRPFVDDDLAAFLTLAADLRVTRHVGDGSPWDTTRAITRARAATVAGNHWYSVVVDDHRWAGIVILERTSDEETELGIWIHPDHWGGGVATRAAIAVLEAHFPAPPAAPVIAHVSPDNVASRKLLARIGFHPQSTVTGRHGTLVERHQWQIHRAPRGC